MDGDRITCRLQGGEVIHGAGSGAIAQGQTGALSLRPERLTLSRTKPEGDCLSGTLSGTTYLGTDTQYDVSLAGDLRLSVRTQNSDGQSRGFEEGDPVFVSIADDAARFLVA